MEKLKSQISFLSGESRGSWEEDESERGERSSFLRSAKALNVKRKVERSESASSCDTDFLSLKRPRFTSLKHAAPVIGISDVLNSSLLMGGLVKDEDGSDKEEADFKCDNSMAVEWSSDDSNGERLLNREDSLPITSPSPLLTADLPSHALDVDADKSSTVASLSSAILGQRTIVVDLAHFEDDDESSSVATSLFVEVASVDEGGSYQGYGGASETEKYEIEGDDDETVITDNNSFYLGDSSYNRAPSSSGKRAAVRGSAYGSSNCRGSNRDAKGSRHERLSLTHRSSMKAWEWESGYDGEEDTSERGGLRDGGFETDADLGEEMEEIGSLTEEEVDEDVLWDCVKGDGAGSRDNLSTMATANGDTRECVHSPSLSTSSPSVSLAWSGASPRSGSKRRYRKKRYRPKDRNAPTNHNGGMPIQ